jgi:dienelactone hydrolase
LLLTGFSSSPVKFESLPVFADSPSGIVSGTLSRPEGKGPFPAVVLLHTCGGITETVAQFWPRYLARLGYASLAVDSLSPRGFRNCRRTSYSSGDVRRMVANDAYGALQFLAGRAEVDKQRIGVMGFSLGGIAIARFATSDFKTPEGLNFRAAITLYGHCSSAAPGTPPHPGDPKFPWLIANGERERESNHEACRALEGRPGVTFVLIEGAHHAFDDPRNKAMRDDGGGNKMLYSSKATTRAQELIKDFLARHL